MEQRCIALKANGDRCTRNHVDGHRCRQHGNIFQDNSNRYGPHVEGRCQLIMNNQWCPHNALPNQTICDHHSRIFARRREREAQAREHERIVRENVNELLNQNPRPTWRQVVDTFMNNPAIRNQGLVWDIGLRYFHQHQPGLPTINFVQYIAWVRRGRVGEPPADVAVQQLVNAINPLARLAADPQNVHTGPVSHQTNKAMNKLLEASSKLTRRYRTPEWFAARWLTSVYGPWDRVKRVVDDMCIWYTRESCRNEGDQLYRRAVDGLYELIRNVPSEETRYELLKRAFEECYESVNMCCEGHLSRLCNVMVGFDETFEPPVSTAEVLQNRMGAIFLLDVSTDEKIIQAKKVLDELGIPQTEHAVWLEAF